VNRARRTVTVVAVARYLTADVLRSQRFLLPVVVYGAVLAVLYGGDPGPPPASWAASALVLYPVTAWLAFVVANTEDPVQRTVTVAAAGGHGAVVAGTLVVALAGDVLLVAASVLVPVLVTAYPHPPALVLLGLAGHLACAVTGTAVGLLCARPLVTRVGWSLCLGSLVVLLTAVWPELPPVGTSVRALTTDDVAPLAEVAVAAVAVAVAAAVATVAGRRAGPR
jgi:hypothetical protein